jgi:hypothetical protein
VSRGDRGDGGRRKQGRDGCVEAQQRAYGLGHRKCRRGPPAVRIVLVAVALIIIAVVGAFLVVYVDVVVVEQRSREPRAQTVER